MKRSHLLQVGWGLLTLVVICLLFSVAHPWLNNAWQMWMACCRFVQMMLPRLITFPLVLVARGISLLVILFGFAALFHQLQRMQHFSKEMRLAVNLGAQAYSLRLQSLTAQLALMPYVVTLKTSTSLAFCYGLLEPRIYISDGLIETLTDGELRAVLLHEDHHRCSFHPLCLLLADLFANLFFFLPMIGAWRDHVRLKTEVAADQYAEHLVGRPPLASALYKLLTQPAASFLHTNVSGISGFSANATRVARILGDSRPTTRFSLPVILHTSGNLVLACVVLQAALLPLLFC